MKNLLIVALIVVSSAGAALARGRTVSGGNVVHSRRAPVAVHRALPPFSGVHVYGGR